MNRKKRKRASVLIVDALPAAREGLAIRIDRQNDLEVCGETAEMSDALRLVSATQPDVAVIDISLKSGNGIDLIKRIRGRDESTRILVWSIQSESLYAERALRAGALGYINKDQATEKIVEAIRHVLQGKVWLSESMAQRLLRRTTSAALQTVPRSLLDTLSDRELEVFLLIGQGEKNAEIAEQMHLSVKTVETYRDRIRQKLGLNDGIELRHYATKCALESELSCPLPRASQLPE